MSDSFINIIRNAWGWTGVDPVSMIATNAFGNVVFQSADETIWRICPEELSCTSIALNRSQFEQLWVTEDFQIDWQMTAMVELAHARLGPLLAGQCYCLKMPSVLGGEYSEANIGINEIAELLAFAGELAEQIKDLPDGSQVIIRTTGVERAPLRSKDIRNSLDT